MAVVAVIAYHLGFSWAKGGFLGVDLFFVLSGYLITSLLLAEWRTTGSIDFALFWTRRARRLLPASLLMIAVVAVVMPQVNGLPTAGDALASVAYSANWHFISGARSYFADLAQASPFRHMWSLAIEEQFYLLWPVLFAWTSRARIGQTRALTALVAAGTLTSVALMAVLHSPADPSRSYYGTDTRIHQLLLGIGLALLMVANRPAPVRLREKLAALGIPALAAMGVAFVLVSDNEAFYYRGGSLLFSVCVAIALIHVETRPIGPAAVLLSASLPRQVGAVSYGLYLWHWPVIVYLSAGRLPTGLHTIAVLVSTVLIAALSYRFVEQPIRSGRLGSHSLTPRRTAVIAPSAMAVVAGVIALTTLTVDSAAWLAEDDASVAIEATGDVNVALVGDSVAASLVPGFAGAAEELGYGFVSFAKRGCAIVDGFQVDAAGVGYGYSQSCDDLLPAAFDEVASARPDVVIWYSARESIVHFLVDGAVLAPGTSEHDAYVTAGFEDAVDRLTGGGSRLVVVLPLPPYDDACDSNPGSDSCRQVEQVRLARARVTQLLTSVADRNPRVMIVDASAIVCGNSGSCSRTAVGDLRPDGNHFTDESAALVAPKILELALR